MQSDANELSLGVSEFVSLLNQTFDLAYPSLLITGELANLRISKNKWVYFDLKDESSSVKFFGTVYQLPGPLEDGMLIKVRGAPRLHNMYGFSVTVQSMTPTGEGTIKRAAELLQAKLQAEGLFDPARKRVIPHPPKRIGLIASGQSAAYADFIKILDARWGGIEITHIDVQVQGEAAPAQIVGAIEQCNALAVPPDVIVVIRGGGSPEDLAAFSAESVTRAVAASRVPTMVGIGHEIDISLAELAADCRASTPSNAAELLVPERSQITRWLHDVRSQLDAQGRAILAEARRETAQYATELQAAMNYKVTQEKQFITTGRRLLSALNPQAVVERGYAIVRQNGAIISSVETYDSQQTVRLTLRDGDITINPKGVL